MITHGYGVFSGYDSTSALIRHTVRKGNVVIYPRWQTDILVPCPGPLHIEPCMRSAVEGIHGALDYLKSDPSRVQPELDRVSYFGFSFGGILTANMLNRWESLDLPRPRAMFLDDPHDGGFAGDGEPALDDELTGIPSDILVQCHSGANGVMSEQDKQDSSCNALFPKLSRIPTANKSLVMSHTDTHGQPELSSMHGVSDGSSTPTADSGEWSTPTTTTSSGRSGTRCAMPPTTRRTANTPSVTPRASLHGYVE